MKGQSHNQGELKELKVQIEKQIVDRLESMAKHTNISLSEMVVIALKRYISHHADYENSAPSLE
jgi:metal-responsive CopG/Arc/MetJ family transcriptional regulator